MFYDLIMEMGNHLDYINSVGWIIAFAIVIGSLLDEGRKQLKHWVIAIVSFLFVQEMSRYLYWGVIHKDVLTSMQGLIISLVTFVADITGLFVGWYITRLAKRNAIKRHGEMYDGKTDR